MTRLSMTEPMLLDVLCRKFAVDSSLEEAEAFGLKLLSSNDMKAYAAIHESDERNQHGHNNNNDSDEEDEQQYDFNDKYLTQFDPMNAIGLQEQKKRDADLLKRIKQSCEEPNPEEEKQLQEAYVQELQDENMELKNQLAEMQRQMDALQKENAKNKLELDQAKRALAEFA